VGYVGGVVLGWGHPRAAVARGARRGGAQIRHKKGTGKQRNKNY